MPNSLLKFPDSISRADLQKAGRKRRFLEKAVTIHQAVCNRFAFTGIY